MSTVMFPATWNGQGDDKPHEECGVIGLYGNPDAAALTALGLHALQHRGQEACGIVTNDAQQFHAHRDIGLVGDVFGRQSVMQRLPGHAAVGHNRYATTGEMVLRNVQPLFAELSFGGFAIAHNGNLTNALQVRDDLVQRGSLFQSTTDTEVIVQLMAISPGANVADRLVDALRQVEGAYSLVGLAEDAVFAIRDPMGLRPLVLGRLGDAWLVASETCALDILGADFVRDVEPGELLVLNVDGVTSYRPFPPARQRFCVFEHIYFARPDSMTGNTSVYALRKSIGAELAREAAIPADLVVPIPDSGVPSALGYAEEAQLPFELGIIRNHYVGRTFIEPTDEIRHLGVKLKHNANRQQLEGKRVILVDDSIVRGITSRKIVEMVRAAGAREVHMRISSPPTMHSCFYGVDTPERKELLAANNDVDSIARLIDVDSLAFISIDGLYRALGHSGRDAKYPQFCDACFTGDYPIALTDRDNRGANARQLSLLTEMA